MSATAVAGAETVHCPACHAGLEAPAPVLTGLDRLTDGGSFRVLACDRCGLAFTEARPSEADFATFYPETYYAHVSRRPLLGSPGALVDRLRIEAIVRFGAYRHVWRAGPCRILDVGCGTGDLIDVFAAHGYDVAGLEPSPAGAAVARDRGLEVQTGTLADAPWAEGSFDAVVFNHSLEHIEDPADAIARAAALLRPGGLLAVAVPNFGSWHRRLFGRYWFQLDVPRHLQHFDRSSLPAMLRAAGLRPVGVQAASMRPSLLGTVQNLLFGRLRYDGRGFRVLTWALLPLVAVTDLVGEGDCLHVTAQR
jgi:SAM-dependent methyltransferase